MMHRNRLWHRWEEATAIDQRDRGRQHEQLCDCTQQNAAAGDHAQFRNPHKAREGRGEEGYRGGDRTGQDARPDSRARTQQRRLAVLPAASQREIPADVVGAVVDTNADHRDRKRHAENVEVADRDRCPGKRPGHADHQHTIGEQGMPHTTKASDNHHRHCDQRQHARLDHRVLARPHLVVFHDRKTCQTDLHLWMPC